MSNALEVQHRDKYTKFGGNKFFSTDDSSKTRSVSQVVGLSAYKSAAARPGL